MKKINNLILSIITVFILFGCGGGGGSSTSGNSNSIPSTDNNSNSWNLLNSDGYSGKGVLFANKIAASEWNVYYSGTNKNNFSSTNLNLIKLDDMGRYHRYRLDFINGSGYIPTDSYGVSQDGLSITIENNIYSYKFFDAAGCINTEENITKDKYRFCKIN